MNRRGEHPYACKSDRSPEKFLCGLFREGRLTDAQLTGRLRALEALAAGKLRPVVLASSPAV